MTRDNRILHYTNAHTRVMALMRRRFKTIWCGWREPENREVRKRFPRRLDRPFMIGGQVTGIKF